MGQRPLLVRLLWFLLVGWWATAILVNVAWLCMITIVLSPIGVKLLNLVPTALTLLEPRSRGDPDAASGQYPLVVRAVYFVFVGWWASWLWANLAFLFAVTIIGLPVAYWLFNRLPFVASLYRFHG